MALNTRKRRKPAITITRSDYERLLRLAESASDKNAVAADVLSAEIDRARVVNDRKIAARIVRMGSRLTFTTDAGEQRTVTLVFPGQADIAEGKISILTPIGAALIGLSAGQSIDWTARDGRTHRLTVETVEAPVEDPQPLVSDEMRPA